MLCYAMPCYHCFCRRNGEKKGTEGKGYFVTLKIFQQLQASSRWFQCLGFVPLFLSLALWKFTPNPSIPPLTVYLKAFCREETAKVTQMSPLPPRSRIGTQPDSQPAQTFWYFRLESRNKLALKLPGGFALGCGWRLGREVFFFFFFLLLWCAAPLKNVGALLLCVKLCRRATHLKKKKK